MKKIGLIGYGELAKQIEKMILERSRQKTIMYYFDDIMFKAGEKNSMPFNDYLLDKYAELEFYVCLGYKHTAKKYSITKSLLKRNRKQPSFIHKTAYVNKHTQIGRGTIIYPLCNIDKNSIIGDNVILNNSVVISHDNKIGSCCYLSPGVVTSGFVNIGDRSFIGTGTVVSNGITISEGCIIGIGSVVTKNIPPNKSAIGNPIRILKKRLIVS
jgi:sugar O-acyltransferase (sialic acid O-acetyltransferase NeuD family)